MALQSVHIRKYYFANVNIFLTTNLILPFILVLLWEQCSINIAEIQLSDKIIVLNMSHINYLPWTPVMEEGICM